MSASAQGLRQVGYFDCPGGGQVVVDGRVAYIAHMKAPHGTSIVDVSDPKAPRQLAALEIPAGTHSHKVRAANGLMLVNREAHPAQQPAPGALKGLGIFDVSQPSRPREIAFWKCGGAGVHRFTFDGRYAYISPEMDGYVGNIVMILDLADPAHPQEVGRWWMPGQWAAGGETPSWSGRHHRCHHPIRVGNRLYTSYWHGGFVILGIDDIRHPEYISGLDWSPPYPCPTHTVLPIPHELMGRKIAVVTDEEVGDRLFPSPNAFLWMVDITDEKHPVPVATWRVPHDEPFNRDCWFGAHQPQETVNGNIILVTWFAGGLRAVDISNPYRPEEVAFFMPSPGAGQKIVQSNDVFVDKGRGLVFLIDRLNGLDILEYRG